MPCRVHELAARFRGLDHPGMRAPLLFLTFDSLGAMREPAAQAQQDTPQLRGPRVVAYNRMTTQSFRF